MPINKKTTTQLFLYPGIAVKKALEDAAKEAGENVSASSLGVEIISEWLVKNKYLKTVKVEVVDSE